MQTSALTNSQAHFMGWNYHVVFAYPSHLLYLLVITSLVAALVNKEDGSLFNNSRFKRTS